MDIAALNAGFTNFKNFQNTLKKGNTAKKDSSSAIGIPQKKLQTTRSKVINPYRNLLVAGVNELLQKRLISLNSRGLKKKNDDQGHIFTEILGFSSVVRWRDIGFGELEISVWWKYDHSRHPQAELSGRSRENFNTSSPLDRKELYKNFVGVTVTG